MQHLIDTLENEEARLNALRDLRLLDTPPSESFDRLTRLASQLLSAPVSTISLTDRDRQWFKSKVGVDITEIPREQAPCSYAIEGNGVFVVPDLGADPRFAASPLVQAGIRFYAGAPLFTRSGHGIGTLCVVDDKPREITENETRVLQDLAGMVMSQVELQNMIGRVDATTGLPNQHQMFEDLEDLARRDPADEVTVLLIEIMPPAQTAHALRALGADHADLLTRRAMSIVQQHIGNSSRLYHVGQMRCAVLMDEPAVSEARTRQIMGALREPISCGGIPITPNPAVGFHVFLAGKAKPRDVFRHVLNAVEDARTAEGNLARYCPTHDQRSSRSFALLSDFAAALSSDDQLSLVYQPRVELASQRLLGVEALLRWKHPTLGQVSPGEFIPLIEQTAMARSMTDWVVSTAVRQAWAWKRAGLDLCVSINASALNLEEPDFAARLLRTVHGAGLEPRNVELEFTESAVAKNTERVVEQLKELRSQGMGIAIDDFGTGYSNLAYIQRLPISVLKIDQAFMRGLPSSAKDRLLVRTIITMAHDLGYRVVAEGIETQVAYDMLRSWGCDEGQGYLMSRPVAANAIWDWQTARLAARPADGQPSSGASPRRRVESSAAVYANAMLEVR